MRCNEAKAIARDTERHATTTLDLAERTLRDARMPRLADRCAAKARGNRLLDRLRYHVSGAIERGEAVAIVEIPAL